MKRVSAVFRVGDGGKWTTLVLVAVVLILLSVTPLAFLIVGTFFDGGEFSVGGFVRAYTNDGLPELIGNSLVFSIGSSILSLVIGTVLAYLVIRTNVPFRGLLLAASIIPLAIPGLLYGIAWILLASPNVGLFNQISRALLGEPVFDVYTMGGMIWVQGTHGVPLVFLFMVAAFRSMDPSLEDSALVFGARRMTLLRRITIPLVRPAVLGALLITVIDGLTSFEVPVLFGLPARIYVFVSRIFTELRSYPQDYGEAGALSMALIAVAVIGTLLINRDRGDSKEFATVTGKGFRPAVLDLGRARWPLGIAVIVYFLLTTVLPMAVLLWTSFLPYFQTFSAEALRQMSFDNYATLFGDRIFGRTVVNSVILALGSATIIMVLTAVAAWLVVRTRIPGRRVIDQLAFLPLVIPGLVMGVAIAFVYLRNPLPIAVYGTIAILFIAYVTRFMPYGMRYSLSALSQISPELEESASVSGASWARTMWKIVLPLMIPGLAAGWIYIVIIAVRELSSSILLYSPGNEVISILIFQLYERGDMTVVSALSVVMVFGLVVLVGISNALTNRLGIGAGR